MSNITSIASFNDSRPFLNPDIPTNIHRFENFPVIPAKFLFMANGAYGGKFCSDVAMILGKSAVGTILNAITNIRSEHVERKIGYTLGALFCGNFIDKNIKGVLPLLNSYGLAMKVGAVFSALKAASVEGIDLQPEDDNYTFAWELGMAAGGLVTAILHSNDASFMVSLAAGSLTANQVTKLYCRFKNAELA